MADAPRIILTCFTISAAGCTAHQSTARLRQELLATDKAWLEAVAGHDIDRILACWTDDAVIYAPGGPPVAEKKAIRTVVERRRSDPNAWLSWETSEAVVAGSGDLAYTLGPYEFRMTGPNDQVIRRRGHYISVWRREGGRWRCALEFHTPLTPAPGRSTSENPN